MSKLVSNFDPNGHKNLVKSRMNLAKVRTSQSKLSSVLLGHDDTKTEAQGRAQGVGKTSTENRGSASGAKE